MGVIDLSGSTRIRISAICALLVITIGCATATPTTAWPEGDVAKISPPEAGSGHPQLMRGDDGLVYSVGDFEEQPQAGQVVLGRYGDEWPLDEMHPPALFAGIVVEEVSEQIVRVHPLYEFPETQLEELSPEFFDEMGAETMGKGIGSVEEVDFSGPSELELSLGSDVGVTSGDMYALLQPYDGESGPEAAQFTRRLLGICMVVETDTAASTCRLRVGHPAYQWAGTIRVGHEAIFLEPTFGNSPRDGRILVSQTENDELNTEVTEYLNEYVTNYPGGAVTAESIDKTVDATDPTFHRWNRELDAEEPALFVGMSIDERDGREHLILNYTGIGVAVGPGMVAAPPEGGVDMGPVDEFDPATLRGFSSIVMGTMLIFRGQTSEALIHLHDALRDPALSGEWRWHARDQYAMRWGALDRVEEAMWLIHEDMVIAEDERAYLNALGTRVRLHDLLEQPELALQWAEEYLETRRDERPEITYISALGMYAEMAAKAGETAVATEIYEQLIELCPDGCGGDIIGMLAGIYWGAMETSPELQDEIVATMVEMARAQEETSMANARMFQGWTFMRDTETSQAMIAFLEAQRLFEQLGSEYGQARAQFYIAWMQIGLENQQDALERGMDALEYMKDVGDFGSVVRIYERLSQMYLEIDPSGAPQVYLGSAMEILRDNMQVQIATGDYARAAEASFAYGQLLFLMRNTDDARHHLQRAEWYGLRVAQFDTVAMSHILLAIIARMEGDMVAFEEEISQAQVMAELIDQPAIDELIESILEPPEDTDDPTQLL